MATPTCDSRERWRRQRKVDELANSLTHGVGLVASVVGLVVLLYLAVTRGGWLHLAGFSIYGVSLVLLYGFSTLYHSSRSGRRKLRLRTFDHCSIYLLIAGTYTPFALLILKDGFGWGLFTLVWILAVTGIVAKIKITSRASFFSTLLFLGMGWMSLFVVKPLQAGIGWGGFALVLGGGIFYTVGTYFFHRDHRPYFHALWHVFVMLGSALHYFAVVAFTVPWG